MTVWVMSPGVADVAGDRHVGMDGVRLCLGRRNTKGRGRGVGMRTMGKVSSHRCAGCDAFQRRTRGIGTENVEGVRRSESWDIWAGGSRDVRSIAWRRVSIRCLERASFEMVGDLMGWSGDQRTIETMF